MKLNRASGILLHPTSLPGPDGIGDLGLYAYKWVDFLKSSGCKLWQVLPLGPTGFGDSPYQCFSSFAGNPNLISPSVLLDQGLLNHSDLSDRPQFPEEEVNYGTVIEWKHKVLRRAYQNFIGNQESTLHNQFKEFKQIQSEWLDDYALFMAIKNQQGNSAWIEWPEPLRFRDSQSLSNFKDTKQEELDYHAFLQFTFNDQWQSLHNYANQSGVIIIGDIPIFVAYDSADVWNNKALFCLDQEGYPTVVAGVPPDYFSSTGQLWGNPLYNWAVHEEQAFSWWLRRLQAVFHQVDTVRLDHFRGFDTYWEIPYGKPTAIEGRWVEGPGESFFRAVKEKLGELPFIAEDLGIITKSVTALRDAFNLPGMKILQFAFSTGSDHVFLPHNYPEHCVAYTGTHDNNTSVGWYQTASQEEQDFCRRYLARSGQDIAWSMIRILWQSVAKWTLAPMQDLLSLGDWARMNYPGTETGNWRWRLHPEALTEDSARRMYDMNYIYGRLSK